jgi:hypothetical protein
MPLAAPAGRWLLAVALMAGTVAAAGPADAAIGQQSAAARTGVVAAAAASKPQLAGLTRGFELGAITNDLVDFDKAIGYRANLRMLFLRWGSAIIPRDPIINDAKLGAEAVIELQPVHLTMTEIASGADDAWLLDVLAPNLAAIGDPITISFAPEMNGQWYPWGTTKTTPAEFVLAWQHIYDVLTASPAGKLITWLWQPSAIHFSTPSPLPFWPGSQYVNEIGLDGYYVLPNDTFDVIFEQTIKLMRTVSNAPILVGETAVGATTGHMRPDIRNLFAGIREYHLLGLVWFNIDQHGGKYHQDWRLQDHPPALATFVRQLASVGQASIPSIARRGSSARTMSFQITAGWFLARLAR